MEKLVEEEPSPHENVCETVLLNCELKVKIAESMDPQFLNMVCPFCVVVPYPPPVEAYVNAALGSAFTSIVRVKTLAGVPLLLLTVSVTVVVGAVAVL